MTPIHPTDEELRDWVEQGILPNPYNELVALRARVAKLKAALMDCKRYVEDHDDDEWVPFRVDDALKDE